MNSGFARRLVAVEANASSVLYVAVEDEPARKEPGKRAQDWTPEEKFQAVMETGELSEAELGVYVRRHGLHATQLDAWRAEVHKAAVAALGGAAAKGKRSNEQRDSRRLEREVLRKDKALAETTALLVLEFSMRCSRTRATTRTRGTKDDPRAGP